uniref:40S ribosomal protein S5 n=1 Tax=Ditylenchus dipsaci TaxID=166011 RepID=A0A915EFS6_9BILA
MAEVESAPAPEFWAQEAIVDDQSMLVANIDAPDVKLFGKWSLNDVEVSDISLVDYIAVRDKSAKYLPHSAGRYQIKRFRKATCPVVERLASSMMMHGETTERS